MAYKTAMIGTGARGLWYINELKKFPEFEFHSICDPNPENLRKGMEALSGKVQYYTDYRAILCNPSLEVVFIMSPDYLHEEMAIESLKQKKHVFLEKPLAISSQGCRRVIEVEQETGKVLIIGFVLRYVNVYQKMKELIENGGIGKLTTCWMLHSVSYGGWAYFHDWHSVKKNVRGLLLQKGTHDFDIINWVIDSTPKKVAGFAGLSFYGGNEDNNLKCTECNKTDCTERSGPPTDKCAFRKEIDVEDNHVVIVEYENGVRASYNECHYTPDDNREYIFIGDKGKLYMRNRGGMNHYIKVEKRLTGEVSEYTFPVAPVGHSGGDIGVVQDFIDCIKSGKKPLADSESAYLSVLIGESAEESIETGKVVSL